MTAVDLPLEAGDRAAAGAAFNALAGVTLNAPLLPIGLRVDA